MKKFAIVIPIHNEEENISLLLEKLLELDQNFIIVLVNDNSSDQSGEISERFSSKYANIKVVHRKKQEGLHAAIISGIKKALELNLQGVITMDGDLSHSPEDISKILSLTDKNDLVIGSRFIKGGQITNWTIKRKMMSFLARSLSRLLLGIKAKDCSSGFKYYSKELLTSFSFDNFSSKGYAFQIETVMRAEKKGFKVKETPITFRDRERGESKVNNAEIKNYFKSLFRLAKNK